MSWKHIGAFLSANIGAFLLVIIGIVVTIIYWIQNNVLFGNLQSTDSRHTILSIMQPKENVSTNLGTKEEKE